MGDSHEISGQSYSLVALCLTLGGCAAALVGGLIYKSTKSSEEKAAFVTNLQKTNLEREKAKLKPLDWCSEAYKFDKAGPPRMRNSANASRLMRRATRLPYRSNGTGGDPRRWRPGGPLYARFQIFA